MKRIKILGTGCPKCKMLAENAETAAREADVECQIERVTDITEIMKTGVMMTPGLMVDGVVKSSGKVASVEEIKAYLA
jgi:small redox-active disulfide protein 2